MDQKESLRDTIYEGMENAARGRSTQLSSINIVYIFVYICIRISIYVYVDFNFHRMSESSADSHDATFKNHRDEDNFHLSENILHALKADFLAGNLNENNGWYFRPI